MKDTIDALILALIIDKMEIPENFDGGDVCSGIVNNPFRPILHQKFKQHEGLRFE
jgi:hypothetical protein